MNNHWMLVALHELEGIGYVTIQKLVAAYPDLAELIGASVQSLCARGLPLNKAELVARRLTPGHVKRVVAHYEEGSVVPVTLGQESYPPLLEEIQGAPWVLYTIGRRELLLRPSIAVVGTRLPTVYGRRLGEVLSQDLSAAGLCIVSGLARGIDGSAHRGALRGQGSTIAVLGCGIDRIYPREHEELYRDIARDGLLISEYPPGTKPAPGLFPLRNRIIAGMTLGTLVVEADIQSGSLITAQNALDESREVFALPGPVNSPKSAGTNALIRAGEARLITCAADLVEEFRERSRACSEPMESMINAARDTLRSSIKTEQTAGSDRGDPTANPSIHPSAMPEEERRVLQLLSEGPATFDELIERLQTNFGHLHAILLSLLLKKRIEQLPGSVYILLS